MEKQFNEQLQTKLKTAILLHAVPSGVQEYVYQQMQSVEDKTPDAKLKSFENAKDIAKRFAARRAESNGPTPMDVGNAQEEDGDWYRRPWPQDYPQATPWSEEGPWQEEDVNGIQDAICHGCGGKGHIAPQCPSKSKRQRKRCKRWQRSVRAQRIWERLAIKRRLDRAGW